MSPRASAGVNRKKNPSRHDLFARLRPEIPPVVLRNGSFHTLNTPVRPLVWQEFKLACPANAKHFVEAWQDPGRCPRCGNFMEKSGWPFRVWE